MEIVATRFLTKSYIAGKAFYILLSLRCKLHSNSEKYKYFHEYYCKKHLIFKKYLSIVKIR